MKQSWAAREPLSDISPGNWLRDRLWTWGPSSGRDGVAVGCDVPEGFEAYGRVLHPARYQTEQGLELVRWSQVASLTGRSANPLMQFHRVANLSWPESPAWGMAPLEGSLPAPEAEALIAILRGFTATPDRCIFGLWDGFGVPELRPFSRHPRLRLPNRDYFLFGGPIDAVPWLTLGDVHQSPNLWWPEDHAWLVATDIDLDSTYVGASTRCIERIVADPALESFPTTVDARVDIDGDLINAPTQRRTES